MNNFEQQRQVSETTKGSFKIGDLTDSFLGKQKELIDDKTILGIEEDSNKFIDVLSGKLEEKGDNKKMIDYDRRKKSFVINNKNYTLGQIVAARRLGIDFYLPEYLSEFGDGKKLKKMLLEKITEDKLFGELNKELATQMSISTKKEDMLVSKAYNEIAERSGETSKQFGVIAEKIMIGVIERISIDRSDLGIVVRESNAHEDVEDKIDFIISSKHKIKGVGVNRQDYSFEEKSIGVQFTTNLNKKENKLAQISKAKERGVGVDDIIYVDIDPRLLKGAIEKWNKSGEKILGPFDFLPEEIKKQILLNLLQGIITEEQEKSFNN